MKLILVILGLFLCACTTGRGALPAPHPVEVGATLLSIGSLFTWAGSSAIGIGLLGVVACAFFPAIGLLRVYLEELAALGFASVLLGCSFIWLGNHAWLLAVAIGLLICLIAFRYRRFIVSFFASDPAAEAVLIK